ncbi:MAG: tetratricopeptide repeat protein [Armatimonadota bacterium]|jgi:tetratricopeptide (TPR) repeat protein
MDSALRKKLDTAHGHRIDGDYESARSVYEDVIAADLEPGESAEVRWGLGLVLQFIGLFDESLAELERAHEDAPENADFLLCLAKTRLMLGDFDRATGELQEIEEKFPDTPAAEEAKKQLAYFR